MFVLCELIGEKICFVICETLMGRGEEMLEKFCNIQHTSPSSSMLSNRSIKI